MFKAKGYGRKVILATPKTVVKTADEKVSEQKILEEPVPAKEEKTILVEDVKAEEQVEEVKEEKTVAEKPKTTKKTSTKKKA